MTSPSGKPDPRPRQASTSRLWALLGILCVVFTVGEWGCKLYEIVTEKPDRQAQAETHRSAFATALQASVDRRLDQLKQVDAAGLAGVLSDTLEANDCNWMFQCTPIRNDHPLPAGGGLSNAVTYLTSAPPPRPQLFYHPGGPIYIPTVHTLLGLPQALWQTAAAIWRAGGWALLMFGSCGVIWAVVLIRMVKGGWSPWSVYAMVAGAPMWITLMVMLVQWTGEAALHVFGAAAATFLSWIPISGATAALLIEVPHVVNAPHELKKALRVFRKIG